MVAIIIGWIVLSVLVGIAGSYRTIGFFGSFILSLLFSPLVGIVGVALSQRETSKALDIKHSSLKELHEQYQKGKLSTEDYHKKVHELNEVFRKAELYDKSN